jgi:hypothetical protein
MADQLRGTCPACGGAGVPIVYGMATYQAGQAVERGEIALGGCEVTGEDPDYRCRECGVRWMGEDPTH